MKCVLCGISNKDPYGMGRSPEPFVLFTPVPCVAGHTDHPVCPQCQQVMVQCGDAVVVEETPSILIAKLKICPTTRAVLETIEDSPKAEFMQGFRQVMRGVLSTAAGKRIMMPPVGSSLKEIVDETR